MDKFIELADDIKQYNIICLAETWLSETNVYNMKITGYVTHMIYRPKTHHKAKRASGGRACFIQEDLYEEVEIVNSIQNDSDRFWLRLQAKFFWSRQRHLYLFSLRKPRTIYP